MFSERISRLAFQTIAFSFFVYQVHQSIMKYSYSPTSITKLKVPNKEMVYEPYLIVCQSSEYNESKAKRLGYDWDVHLWAGVIQSKDDRKVTWKGQTGNLSFRKLFDELYDYDYSNIDFVSGKSGKTFLSLNLGLCVKLDNLGSDIMTHIYTDRTMKLLAVDPNTFTKVIMDLDPKAIVTVGPTYAGKYDWADVLLEYSVTDNSIDDGVYCRNYDNTYTYENCVTKAIQVDLHFYLNINDQFKNTFAFKN